MIKNNDENYKKTLVIVAVIFVILLVLVIVSLVQWFTNPNSKEINLAGNNENKASILNRDKIVSEINNKTKNVDIVATLDDEIEENAMWCPTFQLIWNDMQDDFTDGKVNFINGNNILCDNLNKQTFKEKDISSDYYYKKYGIFDVNLKKEIEEGINKKFNEKSDILDNFQWPEPFEENNSIFFYSMLKRNFTYAKAFEVFENRKFADTENVTFFGVSGNTPNEVKNQVRVLYYNSKDDFAISLNTKEKDQVIIAKGAQGKTFKEAFKYVNTNDQKYKGPRKLEDDESMEIPKLKIDKTRNYEELVNHPFLDKDGKERKISAAVQTCQFEIDEKGGKVKSEAAMAMLETAMKPEDDLRIFDVDNQFVIMLKEPKQELPYFMAKVSDIDLFR